MKLQSWEYWVFFQMGEDEYGIWKCLGGNQVWFTYGNKKPVSRLFATCFTENKYTKSPNLYGLMFILKV